MLLDGALRSMILPFNRQKSAIIHSFRPHYILPINTDSFFRYEGSLTTPPCEESVIWTILSEPISMTKIQLGLFRAIRQNDGSEIKDNTRPMQPLNGRPILYQSMKRHFKFCDLSNPFVKALGQRICQF
uniref:carbonic anhydrase n=1 Tax=Panagrolaimus superbus TaxID=310955 RepID=A0A914Y499_9BILA